MMKYELTKDLETGNAMIDSEHRQLFDAVNKLMDACGSGHGREKIEPTLRFLVDYVDKHFAHEEQLQQQAKYPEFATHKMFHENYKRKLREIGAAIPMTGPSVGDLANLNAHVGVLISHIRVADKKLGAFLKK